MSTNIEMNIMQSTGQYEVVYPQTTTENIVDIQNTLNNYFTKTQTLQNNTSQMFGLSSDAVPDDVLKILAQAALYKNGIPVEPIGTKPVGTTIYLNENGLPVPYIIVNQGIPQNSNLYDSSCNGTWVLRKDIYEMAVWDSGGSTVLPGADIFTTMDNILPVYDYAVQSAIKTVKIPYCIGNGSSTVKRGASGLQCKIFPLGAYELGLTTSNSQYLPVDGAALSYFEGTSTTDSKRSSYFNGSASYWWTRSPYAFDSLNVVRITQAGGYSSHYTTTISGIRPAFVLSSDFTGYSSVLPGIYDVSGNLILKLPGVQIETGSYVGTGTYGASNPNRLTFSFDAKAVFLYCAERQNDNLWVDVVLSKELSGNQKPLFYYAGLNDQYINSVSFSGNVVSWYAKNNQINQLNESGYRYYYFAIG